MPTPGPNSVPPAAAPQPEGNRPKRLVLFRQAGRAVALPTGPAADAADGPAGPIEPTGLTAPALPVQAAIQAPVQAPPPAPASPQPAPARRGFAALDAALESHGDDLAAPSAAGGSGAVLSTEDKTKQAVRAMQDRSATAKANKAKDRLDMAKFGLHNEAQWLLFTPHRYDDYSVTVRDFSRLYSGNLAVVQGLIVRKQLFDAAKRPTTDMRQAVRLSATLQDARGQTIEVAAFGRPGFAWKGHDVGASVVLRCKPQRNMWGTGLELSAPEIVPRDLLGKIVPIYPPLKVTKGERFAVEVARHYDLLGQAAQIVTAEAAWGAGAAGQKLRELTNFDDAGQLLKALHRPANVKDGERAMQAAKLLSSYTLVRSAAERHKAIRSNTRSMLNIEPKAVEALKRRLPYELTGDQHAAIDGICASLRSPMPMDGLLSGDVGTGKTASFLVPMVAAHQAGRRVMLLTPNLLLISQVADELARNFPDVPVCTVRGGKGGVQGDPLDSIVIGTTALINAMAKGKMGPKPDFLVIDEQHKFSVQQRESLREPHTNKLEATATPIPRTAALAIHGGHDLYQLSQVPVEKTIHTSLFGKDDGKKAGQVLIDALRRGEQAAVIYPSVVHVEPDEDGGEAPAKKRDPKKAVMNAAQNWSKYVPLERIAVLHGQLKDDEKQQVLDDFRSGRRDLLLSSIVIEVGVTLPELKTMLVTEADVFGLVTLHQLRGRLARHGGEGQFLLYSEKLEDPQVHERLSVVEQTTDGFELAEKDAELRGYGDVLGIDGDAQSGATRCLFHGVKIGPRDISFAANLYDKNLRVDEPQLHKALVRKAHTRPG